MVSRCLVAAVYGIEVRPEKRAGQILPTSSPLSSRDLHGIMSALMNTNSKRQSVWPGTIAWLAGLLVLVAGLIGWRAVRASRRDAGRRACCKRRVRSPGGSPGAGRSQQPDHLRNACALSRLLAGRARRRRRAAHCCRVVEGGAGAVTTEKLAEGIAVQIDGALVFLISPGDVTALAGETLESTAAAAVAKLSTAIDETREARNLKLMLLALARAAVATLVFGLALWGVIVGNRWLDARLSAAVETHAEKTQVGGRGCRESALSADHYTSPRDVCCLGFRLDGDGPVAHVHARPVSLHPTVGRRAAELPDRHARHRTAGNLVSCSRAGDRRHHLRHHAFPGSACAHLLRSVRRGSGHVGVARRGHCGPNAAHCDGGALALRSRYGLPVPARLPDRCLSRPRRCWSA